MIVLGYMTHRQVFNRQLFLFYLQQAKLFSKVKNWEQAIASCQKALHIDSQSAEAYKISGDILLQRGKTAEAMEYYVNALAIEPDNVEFYINLAGLSFQHKQWQQAVNYYHKAIAIEPNNWELFSFLGKTFLKQKRYAEAIDAYNQSLKLNPEATNSYRNLAVALLAKERWSEAVVCYQQVLQREPNCWGSYYKLGEIALLQKQWQQAVTAFTRAIELKTDNSWSYYSLAEVLAQQNKKKEAIIYYQKAIALDPNFSWSHYNLGRILHQENQLEAAVNCYQQAIKLNPEYSWSYYYLGEALTQKNLIGEAINYYQKAIELESNFHGSHYSLGRNLQRKGRNKEAIVYFRKAIELEPKYFWSYYYLGEALIQIEKFPEAISCYERAIELKPKYLHNYLHLGKILLIQGTEAIEQYRISIKDQSKLSQAYLELGVGRAWEEISEFQKAVNCYQRAIEIMPRFKLAYQALQYIRLEADSLDQLIVFYQKISKIVPDYYLVWGNLGDVLSKRSRIKEAMKCYHTSCYQKAIASNPNLANLDWQPKKEQGPNFLIIGATKCGTSSLFAYLQEHPQILLPHKKEINFFNQNFDLGIEWYLAHFPSITDSQQFLTGEASPHYLYNRDVERRIFQLFPDIKLIIMLRNPVDRTISEYYHAYNRGLQQQKLSEIINWEKQYRQEITEGETIYKFGFLLNSIYIDKVRRWYELFPPENILVLESESFFAQTTSYMKDIFKFLDIPNFTISHYGQHNVGSYAAVNTTMRQDLVEFFKPYNKMLETYLDRKFNW